MKKHEGSSTIVRLEAANVKRLRAVTITPDGNVVVIRGNNTQGKTSVLDSIEMALGGNKSIPGRPIRDGETTAHVVVETEDLVIERKWTSNDTSYLEVRSHAGAKFPSPQKKLDELVGSLSFDPLGFMREDPKKQAEVVRRLVGLDTSAIDKAHEATFQARTLVNRDAAALAARLGPSLPKVEPVDVKAVLGELEALQKAEQANRVLIENVEKVRRDMIIRDNWVVAAEDEVKRLERELVTARAKQVKAAEARDAYALDLEVAKDAASDIPDLAPAIAEVRRRLESAEATNAKARGFTARAALEVQHKAKEAESLALSAELKRLADEKAALIAAAKFPVEGLEIAQGILTYKGVPLEQASGAEQLVVSVSMGLALNPKLRVLLVRDGSLLDKNSLKVLAKLAEDAGAQVWLECVGEDGAGVIIEDGSVKEVLP